MTAALKLRKGRRWRLYKRDGMRCQLCGVRVLPRSPDGHPRHATLDHIVRVRDGGTNDDNNLRTTCLLCNTERA